MKALSGLVVLLTLIAIIIGWVRNVIDVVGLVIHHAPIDALFLGRVVGIPVGILGAILGVVLMKRFNRDMMNMASPKRVANATLGTLNALQINWTAEEQLLATAAVFLHLADFWGVTSQEVFSACTNLMNSKDGNLRPEFRAVRPYLEGECR